MNKKAKLTISIISLVSIIFLILIPLISSTSQKYGSTQKDMSLNVISITNTTPRIILNFEPSSYSVYNHQLIYPDYKSYFRNNSNTDGAVRFEKDGYYFIYDLSGGQMVWAEKPGQPATTDTLGSGYTSNSKDTQIKTNTNIAIYPEAFSNTNVTYELTKGMMKETFILSGLPSYKDYLYLRYSGTVEFNKSLNVCANNICYTPKGTEDDFRTSGQIDFRDANNNTIFYLKSPIIKDSSGKTITGEYRFKGSDAHGIFYLYINKTFLETAIYPVYIDPTIVSIYPQEKLVSYTLSNNKSINFTLYKNVSGLWDNSIQDLFVFYNNETLKFGANDTLNNNSELYKYEISSEMPLKVINNSNHHYYIAEPISGELNFFNFDDICSKSNLNYSFNCLLSNYIDNGTYYYSITFMSDKNIDPTITLSYTYDLADITCGEPAITGNQDGLLKFDFTNITNLPPGSTVDDAKLCLYIHDISSTEAVNVSYIQNQTWDESIGACAFTKYNQTTNTAPTGEGYFCFNITTQARESYARTDKNISIMLENIDFIPSVYTNTEGIFGDASMIVGNPDYISGFYANSRSALSNEPYLNITYTTAGTASITSVVLNTKNITTYINSQFNISVNATCTGSNCGNVNFTLYRYTTQLYQENANEISCTGNWSNCTLITDGNWSSFSSIPNVASTSYVYLNYTKPSNSTSAIWEAKYASLENYTIPTSCWNYNETKLMLQVKADKYELETWKETRYFYCYDGGWQQLDSADVSGFYEEAIWWGGTYVNNEKVPMSSGNPIYVSGLNPQNYTMNQDDKVTHIFQIYSNNTAGTHYFFVNVSMTETPFASSISDIGNFTLIDNTYPTFSNYWDNNGTLTNQGTALFNVTLTNTNGTVILNFNGNTYLATNLTANVYNVSVPNTIAGVYLYNWTSYGSGSSHLANNSANRYYTLEVGCGSLTINNKIYNQNKNLINTGSCITFAGTNITFNGNGYLINISGSGIQIRAIYVSNYQNGTIKNTRIITSGDWAFGIYSNGDSLNTKIYNNSIVTSGENSWGIYLDNTQNMNVSNNQVNASGSMGYHIWGDLMIQLYNHTIESSNLAWGKPVNYTFNTANSVYQNIDYSAYGEVIFGYLENITIRNCTFKNQGLHLGTALNSLITGNNINSTYGNGIFLSADNINSTISNNIINTYGTYGHGIHFYSLTNNNTILGNNITTSGSSANGINLISADLNYFYNNIIKTSGYAFDFQSCTNNKIYNNLLNSSLYFYSSDDQINTWNITLTSGTNIFGGANKGGNYYTNSTGTGYSDNCTDYDSNSICDSSLVHATDNIDYLPLSRILSAPEVPGSSSGGESPGFVIEKNTTITPKIEPTPPPVVNLLANIFDYMGSMFYPNNLLIGKIIFIMLILSAILLAYKNKFKKWYSNEE